MHLMSEKDTYCTSQLHVLQITNTPGCTIQTSEIFDNDTSARLLSSPFFLDLVMSRTNVASNEHCRHYLIDDSQYCVPADDMSRQAQALRRFLCLSRYCTIIWARRQQGDLLTTATLFLIRLFLTPIRLTCFSLAVFGIRFLTTGFILFIALGLTSLALSLAIFFVITGRVLI